MADNVPEGIPLDFIRTIRMGQENTKLRPKIKCALWGEVNIKGVFQGPPLSAPWFVIYFDHMVEMYTEEQAKTGKTIRKK